MSAVPETCIVGQPIDRPADIVYAFARQMKNLPLWASGLASGIREEGGEWFADSPMGQVKIAMAPENAFGVLDHDVTLPDGSVVHNPFRVTPCGAGSLMSFVMLRLPGVSRKDFDADVGHVRRDLAALAALLEPG